jgi:hypothetical protein
MFALPLAFLCALPAIMPSNVYASETDQYMVWGRELEDSAPELNEWMNTQLDEFMEIVQVDAKWQDAAAEDLTVGYYRYMFRNLLYAKIRGFFRHSETIDAYPPREAVSTWQYQRSSVYRGRSFPYILPMARTIRVGDVYLGTDKISHMLGYGRRYLVQYLKFQKRGMSEAEAREKAIRWGLRRELSVVGRVVDGIASYGDAEANYQGMEMAIAMCQGDDPLFVRDDEGWKTVRRVNILDYITPDLDETYNNNHYWLLRKRFVLPRLEELYVDRLDDAEVQARFTIYRQWTPSLNMEIIDRYWAKKGRDPRKLQSVEALYEKKYGRPPASSK